MTSFNYIYGNPLSAVKSIAAKYWEKSEKKPTETVEEFIKQEKNRLKGCFVERLYFGNMSSFGGPISTLMAKTERTWDNINKLVTSTITGCYTTYMTLATKLHYILECPEATKIKSDIDSLIMNCYNGHESGFLAYKANWNKNWNAIITSCRIKVMDNWNETIPSQEVMDMFPDGHIFTGKRNTDNKKWNWLKGLTPEQAVDGFFKRDIYELDQNSKCAIKRVEGLSIKAVNDILKQRVKDMDPITLRKRKVVKQVNDWFDSMDDEKKTNLCSEIRNSTKYDPKVYMHLLINVYHYDKNWIINNRLTMTSKIKEFIDNMD